MIEVRVKVHKKTKKNKKESIKMTNKLPKLRKPPHKLLNKKLDHLKIRLKSLNLKWKIQLKKVRKGKHRKPVQRI